MSKLSYMFTHTSNRLTEAEESGTSPHETEIPKMQRHKGSRARYRADHDAATSQDIPNISSITQIEGDGEFIFTYSHPLLTSPPALEIQVVPQEYSSYPNEHFFVVFTCGNEAPPAVNHTLQSFVAASRGIKVNEALLVLSRNITTSLERQSTERMFDGKQDNLMTDSEEECFGSDEDYEGFEDFEFGDGVDDDAFGLGTTHPTGAAAISQMIAPERLRRIRRDFRTVRQRGFLISRVCGFKEATENNVVSISVMVDKLCLSEETKDAWNLKTNDYILLLVRYDRSYTTFEEILDRPAASSNIQFRLRKSTKYKPTVQQAIQAFSTPTSKRCTTSTTSDTQNIGLTVVQGTDLALLGVGESMDTFMNTDFVPMLKIRCLRDTTWDAAKRELAALSRAIQSQQQDGFITTQAESHTEDVEAIDRVKLPGFIAREHLLDSGEMSLLLVAAQFAMRYYVRCTDYCMVCHQQVEGNFEALKPYVCGNSLCLFQYMNMGFGPSIDLEVLNQPNVVDLLVSFCYAGLLKGAYIGPSGLREYPTGLDLQVPKIFPQHYMISPDTNIDEVRIEGGKLLDPISGGFNWTESVFTLSPSTDTTKVREGKWMAVVLPIDKHPSVRTVVHHGRVECVNGSTVLLHIASRHTLPISTTTDETLSCDLCTYIAAAYLVPYDQSLDDMDENVKAFPLAILLAATPSVSSMREYLQASQGRQLCQWQRLIPSASKLLRWIIASNRSYIVQVDELALDGAGKAGASLARLGERISGVDGWIQFRFAQGSPEKEVQFQEELKKLNNPQKTILGWHGSALGNWHSIIREGLDFKVINNGRSYGNGVYFGRDFDTSLGYTNSRGLSSGSGTPQSIIWPNSALKIDNALSLSEIVNRPMEFANTAMQSWCYVVQHIHWIQCRYLFVRPLTPSIVASKAVSTHHGDEFIQDPQYVAKGPWSKELVIPKGAMQSCQQDATQRPSLSFKHEAKGHVEMSTVEDVADIEFLLSDEEDSDDNLITPRANLHNQKSYHETEPAVEILQVDKTDFRPGSLDLTKLPKLAPPDYATSQGQKTIGAEIKRMQKIQSTTPVHELGWHIDFENITNMFHWIVELHSFDPSLQLAQDMKEASVTSIVLEIRFGREFPMSPPFLRVIRPRFRPFANGGGGHVTAGGAMCMELLTNSGWSPANSMESVLLQVRMALCSVDPRPARLDQTTRTRRDYGIHEAYEAYARATMAHGWQIPKDLQEATTAMMARGPEE